MVRNLTEIKRDILKTLLDGEASPTNVMYGTKANYTKTRSILNHLKEKGLVDVKHKGARKYYFLTEKGLNCLRLSNLFQDAINGITSK